MEFYLIFVECVFISGTRLGAMHLHRLVSYRYVYPRPPPPPLSPSFSLSLFILSRLFRVRIVATKQKKSKQFTWATCRRMKFLREMRRMPEERHFGQTSSEHAKATSIAARIPVAVATVFRVRSMFIYNLKSICSEWDASTCQLNVSAQTKHCIHDDEMAKESVNTIYFVRKIVHFFFFFGKFSIVFWFRFVMPRITLIVIYDCCALKLLRAIFPLRVRLNRFRLPWR